MDAPEPGGLGGTYAGNPVACAAGLAVLEVIKEENILEKSLALGDKLMARLKQMSMRNDLPPMDDIRGLGAMVAFDIVKTRGSHEPDADRTKKLTDRSAETRPDPPDLRPLWQWRARPGADNGGRQSAR